MYVMVVDDETVPDLDRNIINGLSELNKQWPEKSAELERLNTKYRFIRFRLLNNSRGWVPGSAAYYMGGIADGLAKLDDGQAG
ncbi:hypothetical protein D3C81_2156150 [compost metagenome]